MRTAVISLAVASLAACGGSQAPATDAAPPPADTAAGAATVANEAASTAATDAGGELDTVGFVEHGAAVYEVSGCDGCHGAAAPDVGAPPLSRLVERFALPDDDARRQAIAWLASGAIDDQSRDEERPFPGFESFVVGARLYRTLVLGDGHGFGVARMELADPMPAWSETLSSRDVDALIAHLLATQPSPGDAE